MITKLTQEQVNFIRDEYKENYCLKFREKWAEKFGVSRITISKILSNTRRIDPNYIPESNKIVKLTWREVCVLRNEFQKGYEEKTITSIRKFSEEQAKKLGVSGVNIRKILNNTRRVYSNYIPPYKK